MGKLMCHPPNIAQSGYYQGCQELHAYHDMLLSYYGRENQEDASLRKSPDAIWLCS